MPFRYHFDREGAHFAVRAPVWTPTLPWEVFEQDQRNTETRSSTEHAQPVTHRGRIDTPNRCYSAERQVAKSVHMVCRLYNLIYIAVEAGKKERTL